MGKILQALGISDWSKAIGAAVGALASVGVNLGLPAEYATAEIQAAVTVILATIFAALFPANTKGGQPLTPPGQ